MASTEERSFAWTGITTVSSRASTVEMTLMALSCLMIASSPPISFPEASVSILARPEVSAEKASCTLARETTMAMPGFLRACSNRDMKNAPGISRASGCATAHRAA